MGRRGGARVSASGIELGEGIFGIAFGDGSGVEVGLYIEGEEALS